MDASIKNQYINTDNLQPPALAAVLLLNGPYRTVSLIMERLRSQTAAARMEMIFVLPEKTDFEVDERDKSKFHSIQVVEISSPMSLARGYAAGIRRANAPVTALTQDHAFMEDNWAELIIEAHQQDWAAVGPQVINANPISKVSWADFYISYGPWASPVESGIVEHLPGHNSAYKHSILMEYNDELENLMEGESFFHRKLAAKGYRLLLDAGIRLEHLNYEMWSGWIPKRFYQGRQFAAAWSKTWKTGKRCLYFTASPIFPLIRLWRIQKNIRRGKNLKFLAGLLPVLIAGLIAEACGHAAGYAAGPGDCVNKITDYEFSRIKNS